MTEIVIPDSVTILKKDSFSHCPNLVSVTLGNNVSTMDEGVFYGDGITQITLPNSITTIGNWVFGNTKLSEITIPDSVTTLGTNVFAENQLLTTATIGSGVTSIGENAFKLCPLLTSVTMRGKTVDDVTNMNYGNWKLPSGCVITCTDGDITIS